MPPIGNALTADHLNYLIWRYLQEQGQAKAAVNLQRDWRNGQNPETLPFAKSIRPLALVKLVHKGLLYYAAEQDIRHIHHGVPIQPFFGIEFNENATTPDGIGSEDRGATESRLSPQSRKHGRENTANGLGLEIPISAPSAKRIRRSNGIELSGNGNSDGNSNSNMDFHTQNGHTDHSKPEPISTSNSPSAEEETHMDVDADDDAPAPAPNEARISLPATNGPSVGVQSDKVAELGPETETTLLTLPLGKHVTHAAWNPHDPTILATAGDALCRIWTVAKPSPTPDRDTDTDTENQEDNPVAHRCIDMLDSVEGSLVSTIEWSPAGDILALATRRGPSLCVGLVSLWTKHGKSIDELPVSEDMVLTFRWSPSGKLLLGITNSGAGTSSLIVWHTKDSEFKFEFKVSGIVRDAIWTSETEFIACGHGIVEEFRFEGDAVFEQQSHTKDSISRNWSHIRYDAITRTTAIVAEDEGALAILDESYLLRTTEAHAAEITALAYQPISNPSSHSPSSPRLLATSALDCKIKLWDAKRPFHLVMTFSMGSSSPPMAFSFTADGYLVAAANWNRVMIWSPEKGGVPVAIWRGELGQWQASAMNGLDQDSGIGEEEEIPQHSLSWDANGKQLAYGLRNQVAILNFRTSPSR